MTTKTLCKAIETYFSGPEWSLSFEVGNQTGAGTTRHADAVAMNLWPSRGLAINGIEMKVSRSDWQRELANPAKAEAIHRFCDFWWLAATRGVVKDVEEIPVGWGFLEMTEAGILRVRRQAAKQERASAVDRGFVAGLLRAHQRAERAEFDAAVAAVAEGRVQQARASWEADRRSARDEARVRLEKLTAALNDADLRWLDDESLCRAVAFVLRTDALSTYGGILGLVEHFRDAERRAGAAAEAIEHAAARFGIDREVPKKLRSVA